MFSFFLFLLQEQAFFYSNRLTWVDFLVFDLLENNIEFAHYDFGSNATYIVGIDVLGQFPRLANFYRHFSGRPGLSSYLRGGKKRFKYTVPNMPKVQPHTEKQWRILVTSVWSPVCVHQCVFTSVCSSVRFIYIYRLRKLKKIRVIRFCLHNIPLNLK